VRRAGAPTDVGAKKKGTATKGTPSRAVRRNVRPGGEGTIAARMAKIRAPASRIMIET
jgi:hypothetical protein